MDQTWDAERLAIAMPDRTVALSQQSRRRAHDLALGIASGHATCSKT